MTITLADVMPDVDRLVAYGCPAATHDTDRAYRTDKCRCPAARAAHNQWRAPDKARTNPACRARRHLTSGAYQDGCLCPEAASAHKAKQAGRVTQHARRRAYAAYRRFYGPQTRVSRVGLLLMLACLPNARGFWDEATVRERQLVVAAMYRRIDPLTGELMGPLRIAELQGVDQESIRRYRDSLITLREQRTQRRLARARWRAVR